MAAIPPRSEGVGNCLVWQQEAPESSFLAAQAVKKEDAGVSFGFGRTGAGHPPLAGRRPQLADFPGKVGKGACTYFDPPPREGTLMNKAPSISGAFLSTYMCAKDYKLK